MKAKLLVAAVALTATLTACNHDTEVSEPTAPQPHTIVIQHVNPACDDGMRPVVVSHEWKLNAAGKKYLADNVVLTTEGC